MPETDVLNPVAGYDSALGDSMNPSYGFDYDRVSTLLVKKPIGNTPYKRETQNTGHVFNFGWNGRTWGCAQRIKWFAEQYEDGFFTIVNHDAGAREYVGTFTTAPKISEAKNNSWNITATFEEMPGVPMRNYPSDWNHDSVLRFVSNDRGDQKLAVNGAWATAAVGSTPEITLGGIARGGANPFAFPTAVMTNPGTAGEWAQYEYKGYGFQLWLVKGAAYGKADVLLDGSLLTTVDCYAAAELGPQMVLAQPSVSLDLHRVKVICDGTKNDAATATNIAWWALQVMR